MTETEENELLVDAEMRRREKAALHAAANPPAVKAGDTLENALARLQRLKNTPPRDASNPILDDKVEELMGLAEIPKRHLNCKVLEEPAWTSARNKIVTLLGSGFICALCGEQGRGKTQMGVEVIRANAAKKHGSRFASAMDFFIALKRSYDPDEVSSENGVISKFAKPRLLVLDEMDERAETEWENRLLFHLINKRYNEMRDTILISRRTPEQFLTSIGKSIVSRIQETGGVINADWPSFRE